MVKLQTTAHTNAVMQVFQIPKQLLQLLYIGSYATEILFLEGHLLGKGQ